VRFPRRPAASTLALSLLLVAGTAACADPTPVRHEGPTQLSVFWFGDQQRADRTESALRLYTQRHPDVTVKVTWQGVTGYYDRLATQAVGGNPPDLFQIDDGQLSDYADRGLLLDLTPAIAGRRIVLDGLVPGLAEYGRVDDRTMAVPAGSETAALVYDKSELRRIGLPAPTLPISYDHLMDWAQRVSDRTGTRTYGTADASGDHDALWVWLRSQGRELYAGRRLVAVDTDLTRWFELWRLARSRRAAPPASVTQAAAAAAPADPAGQLLGSGKLASAFTWSGELAALQARTDHELAVVAYPGDTRGQWPRAELFWAGFRGSRHADQVADVLGFLANDPQAGHILGTDRGLSPNLRVRDAVGAALPAGPAKVAYAFEADMAGRLGPAPAPPPRGHEAVRQLLAAAAQDVRSGRVAPATAARTFVEKASAALAT
jgi:multiple sugar transport system substrate-binding protein